MARRRLVRITAVIALGCFVWWWRQRSTTTATSGTTTTSTGTAPAPAPPPPAWVDPVDGACPPTHPVKVNLQSGIFHVPGGRFYDRTVPGRCYTDAASAESDGYRRAKS